MTTPIYDFLKSYQKKDMVRFHMPGHKGVQFLGCEHLDLTEVFGADSLYEADGIIAESEANAGRLFGSGKTVYSTQGSSQCIRAMLYLALMHRPGEAAPVIVAARNVHKAFVYTAALLDFEIQWLWPDRENRSLCGCPVSAAELEQCLRQRSQPPAAVYITSPDYLGGMADISALAEVCHRWGTILVVDNAHGAYLHFLTPAVHPLDLGADMCCDSAHKTLPVLTGGAYLHLSPRMSEKAQQSVKQAMALFGSTSPSYLTLASLDICNRYLSAGYAGRLEEMSKTIVQTRLKLRNLGWQTEQTDPLRITLRGNPSGTACSEILRRHGIECEYADPDFAVFMITPENAAEDLQRLTEALGKNAAEYSGYPNLPLAKGEKVMSVRKAFFAPHERIRSDNALGRICGAPTVSCPPAIPIAVSGERIGAAALELFSYYGIDYVDVLK